MKLAFAHSYDRLERDSARREALFALFDIGLPAFFDLEYLFDRIEREEWGGIWW